MHKLAWMVGCQNPKFQNFDRVLLASTAFTQNASKTAKKWGKLPFFLLSKQDRRSRDSGLLHTWEQGKIEAGAMRGGGHQCCPPLNFFP